MDIANQLQQIAVLTHENSFITAAEQRTVQTVSGVIPLGVNAIDVSHAAGQISIRCLNQQMIVVGHQAVCADAKGIQFHGFLQDI